MYRKLLPYLLFFILLSLQSCQSTEEQALSMDAIPDNASVIVKMENIDFYETHLANSPFAKLKELMPVKLHLQNDFDYIKKIVPDAEDQSLTMSLVSTNTPAWLHVLEDEDLGQAPSFDADTLIKEISYDGSPLHQISIKGIPSFYYARRSGLFIGSNNKIAVQNALLKVNVDNSLLEQVDFERAYRSLQSSDKVGILLNLEEFSNTIARPFQQFRTVRMKNFGKWLALDISGDNEHLYMNGVVTYSDSLRRYAELMGNQEASEISIDSYFPRSSASYNYLSISDWELYFSDFKRFLKYISEYNGYLKNLEKYKSVFDTQKFTHSWVGDEIARVYLNHEDKATRPMPSLFIKTSDHENAVEALEQIKEGQDDTFRNIPIYKNKYPSIFRDSWGGHIGASSMNYFALLDEVCVFANATDDLKTIISDYVDERTLTASDAYQDAKDELNGNSNWLIMLQNPEFLETFEPFFAADLNNRFDKQEKHLSKMRYGFVQYTRQNDIGFVNATLSLNNINVEAAKKAWLKELDNSILGTPSKFYNHRTHNYDYAVQDKDFNLYLISANGQIYWKKALGEAIVGDIKTVDLFRNKKKQLAFNTRHHFYVLDRNGNKVKPFPIKFNDLITQPLAVFDYDKSRNYRFLVVQDKEILMLDKNGKTVKGFKYKRSTTEVVAEPQHIRQGKKDYLIFRLKDGSVKILDRTGGNRIKLPQKLELGDSPFYLASSQDKIVTAGKNGMLVSIYFDGKVEMEQLEPKADFELLMIDGHMAILFPDRLEIRKGEHSETYKVDDAELRSLRADKINNQLFFAFTDMADNKIHVINAEGVSLNGYPVYGNSPAVLESLEGKGVLNTVIGSDDGSIHCYETSIPKAE